MTLLVVAVAGIALVPACVRLRERRKRAARAAAIRELQDYLVRMDRWPR